MLSKNLYQTKSLLFFHFTSIQSYLIPTKTNYMYYFKKKINKNAPSPEKGFKNMSNIFHKTFQQIKWLCSAHSAYIRLRQAALHTPPTQKVRELSPILSYCQSALWYCFFVIRALYKAVLCNVRLFGGWKADLLVFFNRFITRNTALIVY